MPILDAPTGLAELADRVWAQRRLASDLRHRLALAALVLASDRRDLVPTVLADVEAVAAELATHEPLRVAAAAEVARAWAVDPRDMTLSLLAELAPTPWDVVFADHRDAMADLEQEIVEATGQARRLASAALDHVREALGVVDAPAPTGYGPTGARVGPSTGPRSLDRAL